MSNKLKLLSLDESPPVSPPSAAPPWTELSPDVTANILQRLGALEILESAQLVCATWWNVCHQDPAMWRVIKMERRFLNSDELTRCNILCRRAVDRSQGQLVDLHITYDGDDELLDYIANRSTHLRRLTLAHSSVVTCESLSGNTIVEAVKKLPELEEFRLLSEAALVPADIESIATSCPSLNSFALKLNFLDPISHNDHALAISKFMPSLQHLHLDGFNIDNIGLEAILDGCHHLQSLDIWGCFGVDLGGALGERCRAQIKNLVIPTPYCDDNDYRNFNFADCDDDGHRNFNFADYDDYRNRRDLGYSDDYDDGEYYVDSDMDF